MSRAYGKLVGVLQAKDAAGKPSRPVRRIGMTEVESTLMTRFGALTLTLDVQGYFQLVAQARSGEELVVQEGNIHAILDAAGLLASAELEALLREEDLELLDPERLEARLKDGAL